MKVKIYTVKDLDTGIIYDYDDKKKMQKDLKLFPNHTLTENYINISHYIEISLLNNKNEEFEKGFDSLKEAKNFLNKTIRGNKLRITSISCFSANILEELNYVLNRKTKNN